MPLPKKGEKESRKEFMSRCMGNETMNKEYPDRSQRAAICMSKAGQLSLIECVDLTSQYFSEADEKAGYPPNCNEGYVEKDGRCVPIETGISDAGYKYRDTKTGEIYEFARKGVYTKDGRVLVPAYSDNQDMKT